MQMYTSIISSKSISFLCRFEDEVYTEWVQEVENIAQTNLEKPLLVRETRDQLELIQVNFDPQVLLPGNYPPT